MSNARYKQLPNIAPSLDYRKYRSILDAVSGCDKALITPHLKKVSPREVDHFTIIPNKLVQNLLSHKDLTAKHVFVACELAKMCWAQSKYCSLEAILTKKPMANRLVYLHYGRLEKLFNLSREQLKHILRRLEVYGFIRREELKHRWYVHIRDKLAELFFSEEVKDKITEVTRNNKKFQVIERKAFVSRGNIVLHDWFKLIKNDLGHTCFNSILLISEIIYYSRYFEIQATDDDGEKEMQIVSKSRGVVPFFSFKDFQNKFNLSYAQIKSGIDLLVERNLVNLDVVRTKYRRKVQKKTFYTADFEKLALPSKLDFKFKTPRQLNKDHLSIFLSFYTPHTYARKYSISYTNIWLDNRLNVCNFAGNYRFASKFKKFRDPRTLDQIPKGYLNDFEHLGERFSRTFLEYLLNKLASKYPHLMFKSKKGFESFFKRMLYQETSTKTGPEHQYFAKPISLQKLANSRTLKKKLKELVETDKLKQTMQILAKLAKKDLRCSFSTLESVVRYLEKALEHEKNSSQIKRIFDSLPKVNFQQMERYLDGLEKSIRYSNHTKHPNLIEKFRSRLAAMLPRRYAYFFLTTMKMFKIQISGDIFIMPTLNKEYCDMLPRYIKQTIINELQVIYKNQSVHSYLSDQKIQKVQFVHACTSQDANPVPRFGT